MSIFLFIDTLWAGVPYSEEELQELAEFVVTGEILESSCLSYNRDQEGVETSIFEATISIQEVVTNLGEVDTSSGEITLRSTNTVYPPEAEQPACFDNDIAHPIGESGTYYLYPSASGDNLFSIYMGGFIPDESSAPGEDPSCPDLEEPSSETDNDSAEETETKGCSSITASSWLFLLAFFGIHRPSRQSQS